MKISDAPAPLPQLIHHVPAFPSTYLGRKVMLDIFLPYDYYRNEAACEVIFLNDGQQWKALSMAKNLINLHHELKPVILVAIHSGPQRIQEYGTAAVPDYKHRGSKAAAYTYFITQELIPYIEMQYRVPADPDYRAFAGFSLGALSAFDIVWHHPHLFSKAGIFSGSFWWRSEALSGTYQESDRIMHRLVAAGQLHNNLRIWFSAGTAEEKEDRNQNGIIDVIDDIMDLMNEMRQLGYEDDKHMKYVQVEGGFHNEETWGRIMPEFLRWGWGK
jgi:enterochelin esterase-like enzyme